MCSTYRYLSSISLSWWIQLKPDKSGLKKPILVAAEVNVLTSRRAIVAVQGSKLAKSCLNCNKCWLRNSSEDCTTSSVLVLFWHWLGAGCWGWADWETFLDKLHSTPLSLGSLGLQTGKVTKSRDRIRSSEESVLFYSSFRYILIFSKDNIKCVVVSSSR